MLDNDEEAMNKYANYVNVAIWTVTIGAVIALLNSAGVTFADVVRWFGLLPDFILALCGAVVVLGVIIALWGKG